MITFLGLPMRIRYNSPVILTFSLGAVFVYLSTRVAPALKPLFELSPGFSFSSPVSWLTLCSYTLGHADAAHLIGNLAFILLVGPLVEEKYGSGRTVAMMAFTALLTAVLQLLLFPEGILGASGIVLMLIILSSWTNFRSGEVPLTFILVALLFLGREVFDAFRPDHISQFAHVIGGATGGVFGLLIGRRR
jgi:membrane associated rhomboid family serine protease